MKYENADKSMLGCVVELGCGCFRVDCYAGGDRRESMGWRHEVVRYMWPRPELLIDSVSIKSVNPQNFTIDKVEVRDEWGNDMLSTAGVRDHAECLERELAQSNRAIEDRDRTLRKWQQSYDEQYNRLVLVMKERDTNNELYLAAESHVSRLIKERDAAMKLLREIRKAWLGRFLSTDLFDRATDLIANYGTVTDAKQWTRTLTPDEVTQDYESGKQPRTWAQFCSTDKAELLQSRPLSELGDGDFSFVCTFQPTRQYPRIHELGDQWFRIDAVQIIDYDWRYAGWTDGSRRYGPICCTGPLSTLDTVSLLDEWGNDLLSYEGLTKHCTEIEKLLEVSTRVINTASESINEACRQRDEAMKLLREPCTDHHGLFDAYGWRLRAKELIAKYGEAT